MSLYSPTEIFQENQTTLHEYLVSWALESYFDKMVVAYKEGDETKLAYAAHYAWEALPDRPEIHSLGFGSLCDMAEQIFGINGEEDGEEIDDA